MKVSSLCLSLSFDNDKKYNNHTYFPSQKSGRNSPFPAVRLQTVSLLPCVREDVQW